MELAIDPRLAAAPVFAPEFDEYDIQRHLLEHPHKIKVTGRMEREVILSSGRVDFLYTNKRGKRGPVEVMAHALDDGHTHRGSRMYPRAIREQFGSTLPTKFIATNYPSRFLPDIPKSAELWLVRPDPIEEFIFVRFDRKTQMPQETTRVTQEPTFYGSSKVYAPSARKRGHSSQGQTGEVEHASTSKELGRLMFTESQLQVNLASSLVLIKSERDGGMALSAFKAGSEAKNIGFQPVSANLVGSIQNWLYVNGLDPRLLENAVSENMPLVIAKNHPFDIWWKLLAKDLADSPDFMVDIAPGRWRWNILKRNQATRAAYLPGIYKIIHLPIAAEWLDAKLDGGIDVVWWRRDHKLKDGCEFSVGADGAPEKRILGSLPIIPNSTFDERLLQKLFTAVEKYGPWSGTRLPRFATRDPHGTGYALQKRTPLFETPQAGLVPVYTTGGKLKGSRVYFVTDQGFEPAPSEHSLVIARSCTYGLVPFADGRCKGHNGSWTEEPGVRVDNQFLVLEQGSESRMENGQSIVNSPWFRYALEIYTGTTDVARERFNILPFFDLDQPWPVEKQVVYLGLEEEYPIIRAKMGLDRV